MSKFTPQPWSLHDYGAKTIYVSNKPTEVTPPVHICLVEGYIISQEENQANAHLIAAAPELYEALGALLDAYYNSEPWDNLDAASKAIAALKRARGEG